MRTTFLLLLALLAASLSAAADNPEERTVVLVNAQDPESVALGEFYAAQRRIPAGNLVALPMPDRESVTWREFVDQVWQPLQDELVRRGWLDGIASESQDTAGRRRASFTGHRIAYLVLCRGTPLRIHHDPLLLPEAMAAKIPGEFRTNQASVDGELSLLASGGHELNSFVPNPLFRQKRAFGPGSDLVIKVARLDGPTPADARRLITSAIEGERIGLIGRAYVDLSGPHADGDRWLEEAGKGFAEQGFDMEIHRAAGTMPADARFDAPVLYFGWYSGHVNGPFLREGFTFPAGAIAFHIHSFSAGTMRASRAEWTPALVARGAAATVGNVFEPFLQFTHRPELFAQALLRGARLGDAGYYALPVLSWQAILVGDPLYRPFQLTLDDQLRNLASLTPGQATYVRLREANRREAVDGEAAGLAYLRNAQREHPSLPLAWRLAQAELKAGDIKRADDALAVMRLLPEIPADQWRIGRDAVARLSEHGARATALGVAQVLARSKPPSAEAQLAMLAEARKLAEGLFDYDAVDKLSAAAAALTASQKPAPGPGKK